MKTVIAAKNQILASFSADEFLALANSLNEVLHNSSVDGHDCGTRVGVGFDELKSLHAEIFSALDSRGRGPTEIFEAWTNGGSVQIRSISVFGDAADLSYDEVRDLIQPILDNEAKNGQAGEGAQSSAGG